MQGKTRISAMVHSFRVAYLPISVAYSYYSFRVAYPPIREPHGNCFGMATPSALPYMHNVALYA